MYFDYKFSIFLKVLKSAKRDLSVIKRYMMLLKKIKHAEQSCLFD